MQTLKCAETNQQTLLYPCKQGNNAAMESFLAPSSWAPEKGAIFCCGGGGGNADFIFMGARFSLTNADDDGKT